MGSEAVVETARAHGRYFILNLRDPTVRKRPHTGHSGVQLVAQTRKPMPLQLLNNGVDGSYPFKTWC